ncbi:MAG: flavin reductase [Candidatus Bipolaricaulota bacterium]|nr:MAG: flavin reductase [Candidatus Bipolaricaulota bacterium]
MRQIEWYEETQWLHDALRSGGAFVVAADGDGKPNPMTIGWAQVGIVWSRPVLAVLVRESRYTYGCMRASTAFTVSVPRPGELGDALAFCGSRSGRDCDKALETGLTLVPAETVEAAWVAECGLHYECEIIARTQQADADFAPTDVPETFYPSPDYHLVVYGHIVAAFADR